MRLGISFLLASLLIRAQDPTPQDPVRGIVKLFETYRIVMLGEEHGSRQQYDLLSKLVAAPEFAERVNDIVVEFGNARHQELVDRYIAGDNVPNEQVQWAWRDTVGALGPVSPVYGDFYRTVRGVNQKLPRERRLRIVLGDPPIDWSRVRTREDIALYLPFRDQFYAGVVRDQVLARQRKALLIMGAGHFRRSGTRKGAIENELLTALVKPYVIIPGSNVVSGSEADPRFDGLPAPSLIEMKDSWTLTGSGDSYLYLGPRDRLTVVKNRRSELDGTAYGNELKRRLTIVFDKPPDFLPATDAETEQPAYAPASGPPPPLPMLPKPRP